MSKPITPEIAQKLRKGSIPSFVINVFNDLIVKNLTVDGTASFSQEDVLDHISFHESSRDKIFKNKWLNVEDIFRKAGWNVEYDTPSVGDNYKARFTFTEIK